MYSRVEHLFLMALLALMGPLFFVYLFSGTLPVNSSFDAWLSTIYLVQIDDERVTKEDTRRALEEQYGGEEEACLYQCFFTPSTLFLGNCVLIWLPSPACMKQLPQTNPGFNNTPFKFTKYSNAYMLVYIRESDKEKIICNVDEKDIAEHLRVARDEDLAEQIGKDIYFDLVDHDKVRSFRIQKQWPFTLFKLSLEEGEEWRLLGWVDQMTYLSWLLMWLKAGSGLRINLDKIELIPVGRVENIDALALELGCEVEVREDLKGFSLGWWGSCVEATFSKVENGLCGEKEGRIGCKESFYDEDVDDRVIWTTSRCGNFSVRSLYPILEPEDSLVFPSNIIWGSCAPPMVAFFVWGAT
ncbi:Ubiquitin carboxyl-terminal hydrolase 12 [Vitis vinifera]|uniref:Ubiquitin carboxyl-terminal hydrolase 12 n=1 Tax=Vitis vinifera TaxID=29760 RepID=A0A438DSH9_VITVI|nr:Ubiquitin carboxyl-terminal hydrolase 12 [Vitis vinifera]